MSVNLVKEQLPYRLRNQFLSFTELALLPVLLEMSGGRYMVCPKVALNDIFYIQRPNENVHFYNKIFRKHVDFLLCEPDGMKPAFGVEVVRPNGKKEETRSVDQFMEELFLNAGLPLVRVPSNEHYEMTDMISLFQSAIAKTKEAMSSQDNNSSDSAPVCPLCGLVMVLRIYRKGPHAGKRYYGCMGAPACRGVVMID